MSVKSFIQGKNTMKKLFALTLLSFGLSACSSTWHGLKSDASRNFGKTEKKVEHGWDKTKEVSSNAWEKTGNAVKKGTKAVGEGVSKTGEYIEDLAK